MLDLTDVITIFVKLYYSFICAIFNVLFIIYDIVFYFSCVCLYGNFAVAGSQF